MSQFDNVSIIKAANVYFDGKVTSRTVLFADGSKKTLGIMLPGEYEFGTSQKEIMEVLGGEMEVKLPGQDWRVYKTGEAYEVPANAKFQLKIAVPADYCCSYLD